MPELVEKHKKKGLLGLLLLLFGGEKKNLLLIFAVGLASLLLAGLAAMSGRFGGWAGKGANGGAGAGGADASFTAAPPGTPEKTPEELRLAAGAAAVSGKARSLRNDAVNYVSRDARDIADAKAQEGLDKASAGREGDGVAVDGADPAGGGSLSQDAANGRFGAKGLGSLAMSDPGQGLMNGSGFETTSEKGRLGSMVMAKMPPGPSITKQRTRAVHGKASSMRLAQANMRLTKASRSLGVPGRGNLHPNMYQLVKTTAYTMASACPFCANESVALYNRSWATGESVGGAGILAGPGEDPVAVGGSGAAQVFSAGNGVASEGQSCSDANAQYSSKDEQLMSDMNKVQWADGPLTKQPDKCCHVKDYNDKVGQWQGMCQQYNSNVAAINTACGAPASTDQQNCGQFQTVDTCGFVKCWLLFILVVAAVCLACTGVGLLGLGFAAPALVSGVLGATGTAILGGALAAGVVTAGFYATGHGDDVPH